MRRVLLGLTICVAWLTPGVTDAYEQVFQLNPGWNAVYLEVQPEVDDLETVFAGIPVASVWHWRPTGQGVDFVQTPDEGTMRLEGWQGWFPRQRPEHFLSNLFLLRANHAYLVRLDGSVPVTWRVTGTPILRTRSWVTDSYNLTGFQVDPANPPTFGLYFSGSEAHEGQPVYRLGADGAWQLVAAPYSETITSGEAYWVYTSGPSEFQGPLEVEVEYGDGLEYSAALTTQYLTVRNRTDIEVDVSLTPLSSGTPVPLAFERVDEESGQASWPAMPETLSLPAVGGQELVLNLGVRRAELTAERADQVLEVSNGFGTRVLVAIGANTIQPIGAAKSGRSVSDAFAGLWLGVVEVDGVSEAQLGGTEPLPVGRPFSLRLILHVDGTGQVRLVKEVIQMWEEGTLVPDADDPDFLTVDTPGRVVLVTDDDLVAGFEGVTMRDGEPVGLRLSTVAYDFEGDTLAMTGSVSPTSSVSATLTIPADHPTNPYFHRYHPDHDNLDAQFLNFKAEAYDFTRLIELVFSPVDPTGNNPPDWGDSRLGGIYSEKITGIHRNPIFVEGTFQLQRVSAVPVLNQ